MLDIICGNPFRVLGVYSNAPKREIVRNQGKMDVFISAGRSVSFESDLMSVIPSPVERTKQTVQTALAQINLPQDKIKYGLFWPCIKTSADSLAMDALKSGSFDSAISALSSEENYSAKLNLSFIGLLKEDYQLAIRVFNLLISNATMRKAFVEDITDETFTISRDDLMHLYLDELVKVIPAGSLIPILTHQNDKKYLTQQAVKEPISIIENAIQVAKSVRRTDAEESLKAGKKLIRDTKDALESLGAFYSKDDFEYQKVADALADQILQCGINYFNNSDDVKSTKIKNALAVQKYALGVAAGQLEIDRCTQNVNILRKQQAQLPPDAVTTEDAAIKVLLLSFAHSKNSFSDISSFLVNCAEPILGIKEKLGKANGYYLKVSTQVVNSALSELIDLVNSSLESLNNNSSSVYEAKKALESAWHITIDMDKFDVEQDFLNGRYSTNKQTLKHMIDEANGFGIFGFVGSYTSPIDLRTDEEYFAGCKTSADFEAFMLKYPNTKLMSEALAKKHQCQIDEEKACYESCRKSGDFTRYVRLYPNGSHISEAKKRVEEQRVKNEAIKKEFDACHSKSSLQAFLDKYPNSKYSSDARSKIRDYEKQSKETIKWVWYIFSVLLIEVVWGLIFSNGDGFWAGIGYSIIGWFMYINILVFHLLKLLGQSIFDFDD